MTHQQLTARQSAKACMMGEIIKCSYHNDGSFSSLWINNKGGKQMSTRTKITKAVFGFKDPTTGEKLRQFFKKHTGKDVDFNKISHYKNGFKLLLFSIPLDKIEMIGITAASCRPSYAICFSSLNEFIDWYESNYLKRKPITTEEIENISIFKTVEPKPLMTDFKQKFNELKIDVLPKYDPFPFENKFVPLPLFKGGSDSLTTILINGLAARVPAKNYRKHTLVMNMNIFIHSRKKDWHKLLDYLGIKRESDYNFVRRLTPDDHYIEYDEKYDSDVEYLCNYYNYCLNKTDPFAYPKNWFEVVEIIVPIIGGPIACNGAVIAASMFAAPRKYIHYFKSGKSNKEIAYDIYYDHT